MNDAEARVASVPWSALRSVGRSLGAPIHEVLSGAPAERVLDRFLRAHRDLSADERRVCAESIFGVGLWRRRLLPGPPLVMLASLARDLGGFPEAPAVLGVELPPPSPPPEHWADRHSIPDWLAELLVREVGDEAPLLAAAFNVPGPVCLRANRLRLTRERLAEELARLGITTRLGQLAPDCLVVTSPRPNILGVGPHLAGTFEVQDEGSQCLGELLDVHEGDEVLDLCAGAGGKSLQLASLVGPKGRVHATDVDLARLERLRQRASRAGARVAIHGRAPPPTLRVPRVLVDAPCSELGTLRRGPDLRWRIDPASFAALPALQLELVERGLSHLAPGGKLVYATCTLRREENDDVVRRVLERNPQRRVLGDPLRLFPHRHGTDGFFAAVIA